jgi:hypothetical protein
MRINRAPHIPWAIFVLLATVVASVLYTANIYPHRVRPSLRFFGEMPSVHATIGGTPLGLVFGTIALAIFVFAALLGVRKRLPTLRIGHVQTWLRAHIWLTLLTVPLILLHSGFHLGGPMTTLLMALYSVVMVSGFYGLYLQHKMPTLMKENLPAEIVYEQIPNIRAQLCAAAQRLRKAYRQEAARRTDVPVTPAMPTALATTEMPDVSEHAVLKTPTAAEMSLGATTVTETTVPPPPVAASETAEKSSTEPVTDPASEVVLAEFIDRQLLPYLEARRGDKFRLGKPRQAEEIFRYLKLRVAGVYRSRVEEMQAWCDERRLLDLQTRLQHRLHGWLLVHVPLSFLLLLLTGWHAFVTLFRY